MVVLDAFHGGRVPASLTTVEFAADVARVLRPDGVLVVNVADGPPLTYTARLAAAVRTALPNAVLVADGAVLKRRRFGNVVLAASRAPLPVDELRRASLRAAFPRTVVDAATVARSAAPLTDADPLRSPTPPDELWRMS